MDQRDGQLAGGAPAFLRSPGVFWAVVIALLVTFLVSVSGILLPFVLGMLLAYLFDPLADRMERMGLSRTGATAIITVLLFTCIIGGLIWLMPVLVKQFAGLLVMLPDTFERVDRLVREVAVPIAGVIPGMEHAADGGFRETMEKVSQELIGSPGDLMRRVVASGAALLNLLSLLFITPIVSFYCLRDWDRMVYKIDSLVPRDYVQTVREQARAIDDTLAGFVRGQLNVMLILAAYYCMAFTIAGVPFGVIIGLISAVLIIIPYVGTIVSMGLGLGVVWAQMGIGGELYVTLAIFLVGQVLESQILTPKVVGDKIGLHPLWMLFAMLSGAALFGFAGVLLAVPVAAVLGVLVRFMLTRYRESMYYKSEPGITTFERP